MSNYPTPPPTSSPKHSQHFPSQSQHDMPSQDYQSSRAPEPKLPAQDTYWKESYSTPSSPKHWDTGSKPLPEEQNSNSFSAQPPPRRRSSPVQIHPHQIQLGNFRPLGGVHYGYESAGEQVRMPYYPPPPGSAVPESAHDSYYRTPLEHAPPEPIQEPYYPPPPASERRKSKSSRPGSRPGSRPESPRSRIGGRSPKPIYFSPTNRIPSPYSASRPLPRPGFLRKMVDKFSKWVRGVLNWARENPLKAGALSILPILATIGLIKGVGKIAGLVGKGLKNTFGFKGFGEMTKGLGKSKDGKWDYGLNEFVGFGGTKAGPLDGAMKVLHMLMDHWCKLTPSAIPRTASILLQIYFLENGIKK